MEIVTARLTLRRPARPDIDAVLAINGNPEACRHNPSDLLATRADAEDLFRRWDDHWRRHGFGYWAVRDQATGEIIGFSGLKVVSFRNREVLNLFYRFDPASWGSGYATEVAGTVVSWAGVQLPDWPVLARVRPENLASQKVAQNAGLHRAPALDEPGEDGPDWMFTIRWS
ncbi:GNAT family N-acetyltransferase [Actinoplanes sp. N902-109]|uniref:GNAT family N-acetyltransferase n=1 Tax=Actinoplanes sp. (strain N902-109) TaxID=649831 RepID=UPI0003295813|nr:GNAT family N-acetyltransferase [Actinoplanes sp. N902-109]AGL20282.1 putative acetyltransferase [Actinoplanes sp. N902-109]